MFKWFAGLSLGAKILLSFFGLIVFAAFIPSEEQPKTAPSCEPSYTNVCIKPGSADYDCAGGSGNGPNYIAGPVYVSYNVSNQDPYDLDRDGDGVGCEN